MSSTTGWKYAALTSVEPGILFTGGIVPWINHSFVKAEDGNPAESFGDASVQFKYSKGLKLTDFGFGIPADVIVKKISIQRRRRITIGVEDSAKDLGLHVVSGSSVSSNLVDTMFTAHRLFHLAWGTMVTHTSAPGGDFGSLTPAMLNDSAFGVELQVQYTDISLTEVEVDYIKLNVEYNLPPYSTTQINSHQARPNDAEAPTTTLTPTFTGLQQDQDGDDIDQVQLVVERASDQQVFWDTTRAESGSSFSIAYAGDPLVEGIEYRWRIRHRDDQGDYGQFSAWMAFTPDPNRQPQEPSALVPVSNATVGSLTPTFNATFVDDPLDTDLLANFQIQVRRKSDSVSFWDTGEVAATVAETTATRIDRDYNFDGGATVLVNNTAYEWRVRMKDDHAEPLWSNYTAWLTLTPALQPNPPSNIAPSGTVAAASKTPEISGQYEQASADVEAAFQYEIRTHVGLILTYQSGDITTPIATGVTYGDVLPNDTPDGAPALSFGTHYLIRARSKDNAGNYGDWSGNASGSFGWTHFQINATPTTPTALDPDNGVTGDTTPLLTWQHNDVDVADVQESVEIELQLSPSGTPVTGYDPKVLVQATLTHVVTETLTASPATLYQWRVRSRSTPTAPGFSPFTAFKTFTVTLAPTIVIDEPDPGDVIVDPAGLIDWTFSGGSGTQQDYRVLFYEADGTTVAFDTGVVVSTDEQYSIVSGTLDNLASYFVKLIIKDDLGQQAETSLVPFSTSWTPPGTITGLTATVQEFVDTTPRILLSWDESATAVADFLRYQIFRKRLGAATYDKLARINSKTKTTYEDFNAVSGITYEYVVTQVEAQNTGEEVESEPPTPATAKHLFQGTFLHDLATPGFSTELRTRGEVRFRVNQDITLSDIWSKAAPIAHIGKRFNRSVSVPCSWVHGENSWEELEALALRQKNNASTLVFRDRYGQKIFCIITGLRRGDGRVSLLSYAVALQEIDLTEYVA